MKNFFLTAFIFSSGVTLAQDMIITQKNDTLRGVARILTFDKIDRVQINMGKKKPQYTAIEVKSLVMNKEVYHPVRTQERYQLMKLITPGYLSLYLGRATNSNTYDDRYLVKQNGQSQEVPNLSFKKIIGNFLSDCITMKQRIKDEDLGIDNLDKIMAEYNDCLERQTESIQPTDAVGTDDPRRAALASLRSKIISGPSSVSKDAIDMLDDITDKVANNKPVPKYLLDGLQDYLKDYPTCQTELAEVMRLLKNP